MSVSSVLDFVLNNSYLLSNESGKSYDEEFVKELKKVSIYFKNFIGFYETSNSTIKEEKTENKSNIQQFIHTLSQYLQLSENVCGKLFEGFLFRDNKVEESEINAMVTRGFHTKTLLQRIKKFYYEERLSLIRIIRYCFTDDNVEYKIIGEIIIGLSEYKTRHDLFKKILQDYENMVKSMNNPSSNKFDDEDEDTVLSCALNEKIEMLETILIGACSMKKNLSKDLFKQAFKAFKECNFGNEIPTKKYSIKKSYYKSFCEKICLLQSLVLIEISDLPSMFIKNNNQHFLYDSDLMTEIFNTIRKLISGESVGNSQSINSLRKGTSGSRQCDAILMLFVSLLSMVFPEMDPFMNNRFTSLFIMNISQESIQSMNLFDYLKNITTTKPYLVTANEGSLLGLCVYGTIFNLLSLFCYNINLNSLQIHLKHQLIDLFCVLLTPIMTHTTTTSQPLNKGFMKCLEDLSTSFPAEFGLLKLTVCLIRSDDTDLSIVDEMMKFLNNLCYFCEAFSPNQRPVKMHDSSSDISADASRTCSLRESCCLYDNDEALELEKGHMGYLLSNNFIVWPIRFSVWDVIRGELELSARKLEYFIRTRAVSDQLEFEFAEILSIGKRLEPILEFLIVSVKKGIEVDQAISYLQLLLPILDCPIFHSEGDQIEVEPFLGTIDCLIRLLAICLELTDDAVLIKSLLSSQYIFPLTSLNSNRIFSNESLLKRIWRPSPTESSVTVIRAYLQFCVQLIRLEKAIITNADLYELVPTSLLHGCIFFVTDELLPNLMKSGIEETAIITEISIGCFLVLSEVLGTNLRLYSSTNHELSRRSINHMDDSYQNGSRSSHLSLLQQLIIERLTQSHNSKESLRMILYISSIDNEVLLKQCQCIGQMLALSGCEERLAYCTRMALSLIDLICTFVWSLSPDENTDSDLKHKSSSCYFDGMESVMLSHKNEPSPNSESSKIGALAISKVLQSDCLSSDISTPSSTSVSSNYVARLLSHLNYPFSVRLGRMSVLVVRHLIEEGCVSTRALNEALTVYSNEPSDTNNFNAGLKLLAGSLASGSGDQVLRCQVMELLSSCLCQHADLLTGGVACILRILGSIETRTVTTSNKGDSSEPTRIDLFDNWTKMALDVMDPQFQIEDEVCVSVMRSFSKLLLSLWLRDCSGPIEALVKGGFWETVRQIITRVINHMTDADAIDISLVELLSNLTGVIAMEFFASSTMTTKKVNEALNNSTTITTIVSNLIDPYKLDYLCLLLTLLDRESLSKPGACFQGNNSYQSELRPEFKTNISHLIGWWRSLLGFVLNYDSLINQNEEIPSIWSIKPDEECILLLKILAVSKRSSARGLDVVADQLCDGFLVFVKARYMKFHKDSAMSLIRAICQLLVNNPDQDHQESSGNGSSRLSATSVTDVLKKKNCDLFVSLSLLLAQFNYKQFDEITLDSVCKITGSYLQLVSTSPNVHTQAMHKMRDSLLLHIVQTATLLLPFAYSHPQLQDESAVYSLVSVMNDRISYVLQHQQNSTSASLKPHITVITTISRYLTLVNSIDDLNGLLWTQTLLLTEKFPWKLNESDKYDLTDKLQLVETIYVPLLTTLVTMAADTHVSNEINISFLKSNWPILQPIMHDIFLERINKDNFSHNIRYYNKLINLTSKFIEFIGWKLLPIKNQWQFHLSTELIEEICRLVNNCMITVTKLLSDKPRYIFPLRLTFLSLRSNIVTSSSQVHKHSPSQQKQVTFQSNDNTGALVPSPKQQKITDTNQNTSTNANTDPSLHVKCELSLYRLFSNSVCVYLKWYLGSNDSITTEWFYGGASRNNHVIHHNTSNNNLSTLMMINTSFNDDTQRRSSWSNGNKAQSQVSFGTLFTFLNATVHLTKEMAPLEFTDPLTNSTNIISMDTPLMCELHEQISTLIISQSLLILIGFSPQGHFSTNERVEFLLNLKSELQTYLSGLSKTRRIQRHSSLLATPPQQSTALLPRAPSLSSNFESLGKFFVGLEQFRKSLDNL